MHIHRLNFRNGKLGDQPTSICRSIYLSPCNPPFTHNPDPSTASLKSTPVQNEKKKKGANTPSASCLSVCFSVCLSVYAATRYYLLLSIYLSIDILTYIISIPSRTDGRWWLIHLAGDAPRGLSSSRLTNALILAFSTRVRGIKGFALRGAG